MGGRGPEWYDQRIKELKALREQKMRELEEDMKRAGEARERLVQLLRSGEVKPGLKDRLALGALMLASRVLDFLCRLTLRRAKRGE